MVLEATSGVTQASYHSPEFGVQRSEPYFRDYGHSFTIPWILPHTVGFWDQGGIPTERKLITRNDPEYFATNNIVRSTGGVPVIDLHDPAYSFDRADYSFSVPDVGELTKNLQNLGISDKPKPGSLKHRAAAPTMDWLEWKYPEWVEDVVRFSNKKDRLSADDLADLKWIKGKYLEKYDMIMRFMR